MSPESETAKGGQGYAHDPKGCWCCEANDAMNRFAREFGPSEEVRSHFRQSRLEFLKGIRRIIDERIDRLSRSGEKGTHVNVE
jgi:hypothetical protein